MKGRLLLATLSMLAVPLSGCFTGESTSDAFDFRPGEGWEPTGRTIHIEMWVEDLSRDEIYPGFFADMWAFCAAPADPNDLVSAAAIEYWEDQSGDPLIRPGPSKGKCSVPGPTLRVQQGDKVIVDFINPHFHPHTIHWHGQYVPWESDGVPGSTQDSVQRLTGSFRYEFVAKRAGTMWYHCHVDTHFHIMQGLYGMIIVEPQETKWEPKDIDREYELIFSNLRRELVENDPTQTNPHAKHAHNIPCNLSGLEGCQNPPVDIEPDVFMINGRSFPHTVETNDTLLKLAPGERIRLRMLNAGPTGSETIHLHGHDFYVTHRDGNPLHPSARFYVDTLLIGVGERYDVVVEGREDAAGVWVIHTHQPDHVTNDHQYPGGMLTKMIYPGFEDDLTPFDGHEMAGGVAGYKPPFVMPNDIEVPFTASLGTDDDVTGVTFTLPQPHLACLASEVRIDVRAQSATTATQALNDLVVLVQNADGSEAGTIALGSSLSGTLIIPGPYKDENNQGFRPIQQGNYTISVSGRAVDTVVDALAQVTYFTTLDAAKAASLKAGMLCSIPAIDSGGYTGGSY